MGAHGQLLHDLDRAAADMAERTGRALADRECAALIAIAVAIARSLGEWRELTGGLELLTPWDIRRAGALVLESVFDELLAPPQWRFLAAAWALTVTAE
jgi:hypothetical protein